MPRMKSSHSQFRFWFTSVLLSLVVSVASLRAAEGTNYYLPQGKIDVVALLAPPPLPNSGEQAADLDEVRSVHQSHPVSEETIALLENTNLSLIDFAARFYSDCAQRRATGGSACP